MKFTLITISILAFCIIALAYGSSGLDDCMKNHSPETCYATVNP